MSRITQEHSSAQESRQKNKSKKYRMIAVVMALVLIAGSVAAFGASRAVAYFTASKSVNSTFTYGNVDIVPAGTNAAVNMTVCIPNVEFTKSPQIANNGTEACAVFMTVKVPMDTITLVNDDGTRGDTANTEVFWLKSSDTPYTTHTTVFNDTDNGGDWVKLSESVEGNYTVYLFGYRKLLGPSSEIIKNVMDPNEVLKLDSHTDSLFDKIQMKNYLEGTADGPYDIELDYYGIQAKFLKGDSGEDLTADYFEADGSVSAGKTLPTDTIRTIWELYANQTT